jgi:hypothetical protein
MSLDRKAEAQGLNVETRAVVLDPVELEVVKNFRRLERGLEPL